MPGVNPKLVNINGSTAPAASSGWVVQLGSFAARENADSLTARLQLNGIQVYTDTASSDRGTVYKVRTGPVAERTEADLLRNRIKASSNIEGLVVKLDNP